MIFRLTLLPMVWSVGWGAELCYQTNGVANRCSSNSNFGIVTSRATQYCVETVGIEESARSDAQIDRGCDNFDCLSNNHINIKVIDGGFCGIRKLGDGDYYRSTDFLCCCAGDQCNVGNMMRRYLQSEMQKEEKGDEEAVKGANVAKGGAVAAAILSALAALLSCITLVLVLKILNSMKKGRTISNGLPHYFNGESSLPRQHNPRPRSASLDKSGRY